MPGVREQAKNNRPISVPTRSVTTIKGYVFIFNKIDNWFPSSGLGTQVREAPASRILEAGASRAAFPSRSLGTSA